MEIVIIQSCLGRRDATAQMEHFDIGQRLKLAEKEAYDLVLWAGRALFIDSKDDPTPDKRCTFTAERKAALDCQIRMIEDRRQARAEDEKFVRAQRLELIAKHGL